ncbi:ABC transporter permease [Rheinheimera salexigens]|uniref:ABC transporter permease n=1 Tax=Rheinheimera salexigens TaxID=1628148 RepID=A0A1E7Q736_9GAMM|nr:FtsX-like permease family protein [Rheinheimera salexigens]OEY69956.1 ABC transporter permease [Rheinheimera salexigens]
MWASIAWRLFWRELKQGELWVIAFSLFLAVFSVVSLSGITQGVKTALEQRSAQFIAADKVLRSSLPFNTDIINHAKSAGLATAKQMQFDSMVFAGDAMQLVTVKAVSDAYPLRGELLLNRDISAVLPPEQARPLQQVWLEPRLFELLNIKLGDQIELGAAEFLVAGIIQSEPDAPLSVFSAAPRLLMNIADIPATQIVQPGSRITYRYLFSGKNNDLNNFERDITANLSVHDKWQDMDQESALGSALTRAERFLLLAGLLGIVLAACASAVAANRYSQRHIQSVAVFKALGASTRQVRLIYGSHLALVTLFSLVIGLMAGQIAITIAQWGIQFYFADFAAELSIRPLALGAVTCIICALLFAGRPLWLLSNTAAMVVLKRPSGLGFRIDLLQFLSGGLAIFLLMWLFSAELVLSVGLFVLCLLFAVVLLACAAAIVRLAKPMAAGQNSARRLALANLRRRLWANSFQLITFSLAIFLFLLLYFLRTELMDQWQKQVPDGAPNHFLVNITPSQQTELVTFAQEHDLTLDAFYPVVRGRLTAVNEQVVTAPASKEATTEQRVGVGRELNLTWLTELPSNNDLMAGQWFSAASIAEVSIESQLAERLSLQLDDKLTFSIGGQQVNAVVTSIRSVDWNSLQPNFYMILSPDLLADFPSTAITAFYLAPDKQLLLNQLARLMPTVTVISVDNIIKQVQAIISQVSLALSFILVIIALAAALVLIAQIQATLEQREQELAILRTLGAQYAFLRNALLLEFALLGGLAGGFATVLAELMLFILQKRVFDLPFQPHWQLWWLGPTVGVIVVTVLGWWQLKRLLHIPSAQLVRRVLTG